MLDNLRPILDACGLDENREAGRFLVAFDALLAEAGIRDALVVHHMGHSGERARGDSRLRDWPDATWTLVRKDDDPASPRFLSAFGRDVEQSEQRLDFDRLTRRLTIAGGSRRDMKTEAALDAVLEVLGQEPRLPGRAIKTRLAESDHPRDTIDAALRYGVQTGRLRVEPGARGARLYQAVSERPGVSGQRPADSTVQCPAASIEAGHSDTRRRAVVPLYGSDGQGGADAGRF